jgi:hypothetical protein
MNAERLQQVLRDSLDEAMLAMKAIRDITEAPEVSSRGLSPKQFEEIVQNQNAWHEAMGRYFEVSSKLSEHKVFVVGP